MHHLNHAAHDSFSGSNYIKTQQSCHICSVKLYKKAQNAPLYCDNWYFSYIMQVHSPRLHQLKVLLFMP